MRKHYWWIAAITGGVIGMLLEGHHVIEKPAYWAMYGCLWQWIVDQLNHLSD